MTYPVTHVDGRIIGAAHPATLIRVFHRCATNAVQIIDTTLDCFIIGRQATTASDLAIEVARFESLDRYFVRLRRNSYGDKKALYLGRDSTESDQNSGPLHFDDTDVWQRIIKNRYMMT